MMTAVTATATATATDMAADMAIDMATGAATGPRTAATARTSTGATATTRRVVSLLPAATAVLCRLGVGRALVGVTDECRAPAEVPAVVRSVIPPGLSEAEIDALVSFRVRAGLPLRAVDSARLAEIGPDLVVTQDLCAVCAVGIDELTTALAMVGSPAALHVYDPRRLADLVPAVRTLGVAAGLGRAADALGDHLAARLCELRTAVATHVGCRAPRVAVLEWTDPLWAAGHWVPDVVAAAGGREVLGVPGGRSVPVTRDQLLAAAPDVVVVAPCGLDLDAAVEAGAAVATWLPAGVRVLAADGNVLTGAGPGLVDLAEALAGHLHRGLPAGPGVVAVR